MAVPRGPQDLCGGHCCPRFRHSGQQLWHARPRHLLCRLQYVQRSVSMLSLTAAVYVLTTTDVNVKVCRRWLANAAISVELLDWGFKLVIPIVEGLIWLLLQRHVSCNREFMACSNSKHLDCVSFWVFMILLPMQGLTSCIDGLNLVAAIAVLSSQYRYKALHSPDSCHCIKSWHLGWMIQQATMQQASCKAIN